MPTRSHNEPKMTYIGAAKLFFGNKAESNMFLRVASVIGLRAVPMAMFVDDPFLDFIPGFNILGVGDNLIAWPFIVFATVRIVMIKRKADKEQISRKPAPQAIPVYRR